MRVDFFERFFGLAPDGGNGLLELVVFLIPLAGTSLLRVWRNHRQRL
jgi:hypothetical protein